MKLRPPLRWLAGISFVLVPTLLALNLVERSETPPAQKQHIVRIEGMAFVPKILHVARGDTVMWVNADVVPHAIRSTEAKAAWQSGDISPKASWTYVVKEPGPYICPYHPMMVGQLVIQVPSS